MADFGESTHFDVKRAKSADQGDALSMTMVGTELYCAPEIMLKERYNESVDREHAQRNPGKMPLELVKVDSGVQ